MIFLQFLANKQIITKNPSDYKILMQNKVEYNIDPLNC